MARSLSLRAGLRQFDDVYMPARNLAEKTRTEYRRDIRQLVAFLEGEGIEDWTQVGLNELQAYMAELDRRKQKPSTRNRKAYAIKTFFAFLLEGGYIDSKPSDRLVAPKIPGKEPRYLTEEEYNAMLAQITNNRDRAIVVLFLQTGLRLAEVTGLAVGDIDLPRRISKHPEDVGLVRLRRKGGKGVYLPLNWKACEALKSWLKERERLARRKYTTTDALFLSKYGEKLSERGIQRVVKKYLKRAGIEGATAHSLRHTSATHYLAKGGDIRSVQEMLGHESLETTQIYLSLAKKVQRKMVQELAL
jgi:site-specific recombinase XerD